MDIYIYIYIATINLEPLAVPYIIPIWIQTNGSIKIKTK